MAEEKFVISFDMTGDMAGETEQPVPPEVPPEPAFPEINTGEEGIEISPDSSPQVEPPQRETEINRPEQVA
jgi:hypothetical protein